MSKFRFYVTDLFDGCIKGTDDPETARGYASSEDCFVVDADTGTWLCSEQDDQDIEEVDHE